MTLAKTTTKPFDATRYLTTPDAQRDLISDALATGDATYIAEALGTVARARGMPGIAHRAGITREALYKALSSQGDPRLSTVVGVLNALGIRLEAVASPPPSHPT